MKAPQAARWAVKVGFKEVYVYLEGLKGWAEAGYPIQVTERFPDLPVEALPAARLKEMIARDPKLLAVDVRDKDLSQGIPFKPLDRVALRMAELDTLFSTLPSDRPLVVVDHLGLQAKEAAAYLKSRKLNVVGFLEGGVMGWQKAGYPLSR